MRRDSILGYLFGFFHCLFPFLLGFSPLPAVEGGGAGGNGGGGGGADPAGSDSANKTGAGAGNGGQPGAAAVDVQAEIQKALAAQQAAFNEQFKAATGHDSLPAFQEAEAKRKGDFEALLNQRTSELAQAKAALEQATVNNALLGAAREAVDPDVVLALLGAQAKVENGAVTVNGKPPAEAVKALLKDKPYLAKPTGGQGSGAGANAGGHHSLTRQAFEAMGPQEQQTFIKGGGKVADG